MVCNPILLLGGVSARSPCHGRARPGHPRLAVLDQAKVLDQATAWVAGTRPAMTWGARGRLPDHTIDVTRVGYDPEMPGHAIRPPVPEQGRMVSNPILLLGGVSARSPCHGRACPGHPRLAVLDQAKTWVAGTRPAVTRGAGGRLRDHTIDVTRVGYDDVARVGYDPEMPGHATRPPVPDRPIARPLISIPQSAVDRTAGLLRGALGRVERVLHLLSGTIQAAAGPFGGALLVAGGQTRQHHGTGGNHQRFTHKHLAFEQTCPNVRVRDRLHRLDRDRLGTEGR
jgi:hypothetical protein